MQQGQVLADRLAYGMAPTGECLPRLPVNGLQIHRAAPTVRQQGGLRVLGKLAKLRELAVTKPQHGKASIAVQNSPKLYSSLIFLCQRSVAGNFMPDNLPFRWIVDSRNMVYRPCTGLLLQNQAIAALFSQIKKIKTRSIYGS